MFNSTPFPTREFPQGDGPLHRLAWISRFHLNPMAMSEPAVDLIFTPYRWGVLDESNINRGSSYVYSQTRTARVGSGQLVGLHVGDFVEDRRVVAVPNYGPDDGPETYDLVMDVDRMSVVRADATYQEGGEAIPYIPPRYYPLPEEALSTRCLVVERGVMDPREVSRFIFPCPVLLLAYFATSSGLLKEIVRGGLVYGTNRVFSPARTGFDADGTAHLGLRPRMDDDDARAIARFALVLERLEEAKYIYESMILNADHGDGYVPVVLPPFRGPTRMKLHGKRILSGRCWHFLVFRIQDCTGAYPYERLRYVRDNDARGDGKKDPNRPEAYKDPETPPRHTSEKDEELEVRSDDEPSLERIETLVKLEGGQFSSTPQDVEKLDKDECTFRAAERTPNVNDGVTTGLSTADGDAGETDLDRLRLSRESREQVDLSDRLATFVLVLAEMRRQARSHLRYRTITLPPPEAGGGSGVSFFPGQWRGRTLSWSFLPGPPRTHRRVIVAEVSYCGYNFYLFEAEVRPPVGEDGDEAVTTLVVHAAGGAALGARMLWRILLHGARQRGVWLNNWAWPELLRDKLVHRAGSVERFAERFLEVFQEFVSPPAETSALSPSSESDAGVPNAA